MPEHEFVVRTLEVDWLAPMFRGIHLTGDFLINGETRIAGAAVLATKGNLSPAPDATTANFRGGTPPHLNVLFAHDGDQTIFRSLIFNAWTGFSIFFDDPQLDPNLKDETSVTFKKVKFHRTF
jgi:hypothetical protein